MMIEDTKCLDKKKKQNSTTNKINHNDVKIVDLELNNKTVHIPIYITLNVYVQYETKYNNQHIKPRKAFCYLIKEMIDSNKTILINRQIEYITCSLKEIEKTDDSKLYNILIAINQNENEEINKYFDTSKENNVYERFYIARKKYIKNITNPLIEILKKTQIFNINIKNTWIKLKPDIIQQIRQLPKNICDFQKKLFQNSWYMTLTFLINDIDTLCDINREDINIFMSKLTIENKDKTLNRIKKEYPDRFTIIKEAFNAHDNKQFELSIPTFFTQSDGISQEILDVSMYSKKNRKPRTKGAIAKKISRPLNINQRITDAFLQQLNMINSVFENSKYVNEEVLNRHTVMHGSNINYNTKINSLKCINELEFLLDLNKILKMIQ